MKYGAHQWKSKHEYLRNNITNDYNFILNTDCLKILLNSVTHLVTKFLNKLGRRESFNYQVLVILVRNHWDLESTSESYIKCFNTVPRAAIKVLVNCSLVLHTRSKLVTLWVNSINNRQFHQGKTKLNQLQQALQVTAINDSPGTQVLSYINFSVVLQHLVFGVCESNQTP